MSGKEIEIEYQKKTSTIKLPPTSEEFFSQLMYKFFIPEKMKDKINILYNDEDGDEYTFDKNDNYETFISDAREKLVLVVSEESNVCKNINGDIEEINKKIIEKSNSRNDFILEYKKKLKDMCEKTIKKKLEEVDEKHKKGLEELKINYENKFKKIKVDIENHTEQLLKKIDENSNEIGLKKFNE